MAARAWGALLALTLYGGQGIAGAATAAAPAQAASFRKWPYLGNLRANGAHILFELSAPAPATVTISKPGGAPIALNAPAQKVHEVRIEGLTPSTRHRYRVEAGGAVAEGELTTAPPVGEDEPFTFVVFGDSRDDNAAHRSVVERIHGEAPDFVVSTGDLVDTGLNEAMWQIFFDVEAPLLASTAMFPALGNHDYGGGKSTSWRRVFAVPDNGPDGEAYYRFDWGASRFIVLDSNGVNKFSKTQTEWLERELQGARQDPKVRHLFAVMHHPPFSIAVHGSDPVVQKVWAPLFARYKVNAVFAGHDHVYQRLTHEGVLYVVSGGGGASLYSRGVNAQKIDKKASLYFEKVHHYVRVQVRGDAVELSAIREDGSLIETVRLGGAGPLRAPQVVAMPAAPEKVQGAAPAPAAAAAEKRGSCQIALGSAPGNPWIWLGIAAALAAFVTRAVKRHKR